MKTCLSPQKSIAINDNIENISLGNCENCELVSYEMIETQFKIQEIDLNAIDLKA